MLRLASSEDESLSELEPWRQLAVSIVIQAVREYKGTGQSRFSEDLKQPKHIIKEWLETRAYKLLELADVDVEYELWLNWINRGCPDLDTTNYRRKVSPGTLERIRFLHTYYGYNAPKLAKMYSLSTGYVYRVLEMEDAE